MATTTITWAWGAHTTLDFDPLSDILDFGWFAAEHFTIAEIDGSVVISIPSNDQSYTLTGVTLDALTMANISALDATALAAWEDALDGTGTTDPEPDPDPEPEPEPDPETDPDPDTSYADPWDSGTIYNGGDRVSVGNAIYEANWWTQGDDPLLNSGETGSGLVWTFIGYTDTDPVVPEAPDDLAALNVHETTLILTWDDAEVNGFGTVSAYEVYQDGVLIGTTDTTRLKIEGLTAETTYDFTVLAIDEAGASELSETLTVTTDPEGSDGADDGQYFSPYVDMSLTTSQDLVNMVETAGLSAVTLAFVLSSGTDQIGWGGYGTIENDTLSNGTSIASMVTELQEMEVDVTISFGGANGSEAALTFSSAEALTAAYQSVIDRYDVTRLDFDIEGGALGDTEANALRNEALVALQADNPGIEVSFTLPVLPTGLTYLGLQLLEGAAAAGVQIDVVNIMAMDYGEAVDSGDMGKDAIDAANATIAQLDALDMDALVGITPMIGINDVQSEIFTLEDAQELLEYADGNDDIAYLAMWSLGRDNGSTEGYVSPVGSGIAQDTFDFAEIFDMI